MPSAPLTRRRLLQSAATASIATSVGCAGPQASQRPVDDFGSSSVGILAQDVSDEVHADCAVDGQWPRDLRGTLFRNGPGFYERDGYRKRSFLDGDGMIRRYRLDNGRVLFSNRFVRTAKYVDEQTAGRFLYASWTTRQPGGVLANVSGTSFHELGDAGVSVTYRDGHLHAFSESAQSWRLHPDTLDTLGVDELGMHADRSTVLTAHGKIDPRNQHWCHFGVDYVSGAMFLFELDAHGRPRTHRKVSIDRRVYQHDWFVTANHFVVLLHPCHIDVLGVVMGTSSFKHAMRWAPSDGTIALVFDRRNLHDDPVRIDVPGRYMWHSINGFDDGDDVVCDFVGYDDPDHFIGPHPVTDTAVNGVAGTFQSPGQVLRLRLSTTRKTFTEERLFDGNHEFPAMQRRRLTAPTSTWWSASASTGAQFFNGVSRFDLQSDRHTSHFFGPDVYCGEPLPTDDERHLLVEVHDGRQRRSGLAVFNASHVEDGPLAIAWHPFPIGMSFHGTFVPQLFGNHDATTVARR